MAMPAAATAVPTNNVKVSGPNLHSRPRLTTHNAAPIARSRPRRRERRGATGESNPKQSTGIVGSRLVQVPESLRLRWISGSIGPTPVTAGRRLAATTIMPMTSDKDCLTSDPRSAPLGLAAEPTKKRVSHTQIGLTTRTGDAFSYRRGALRDPLTRVPLWLFTGRSWSALGLSALSYGLASCLHGFIGADQRVQQGREE